MTKYALILLMLMCGTAWGQTYTVNPIYTEPGSLSDIERRARIAAADSLRLIRQVDIVLDYLKAQGYELPRTMRVRNDSTTWNWSKQ